MKFKCTGISNHKLVLKKGVPIILLRNNVQTLGLCNGTKLIVRKLANNVIRVIIVTINHISDKVHIP